jgi:DNA-binding response OmpR family regulator
MSEARNAREPARRVLVVDADPALLALLDEWLADHGCEVVHERRGDDAAQDDFDLVVVDIPFPRNGGSDVLKRVAHGNPGAPILALSSSFFAGIESTGAIARTLGVASVLPKPVTRAALIDAVDRLLPRAR